MNFKTKRNFLSASFKEFASPIDMVNFTIWIMYAHGIITKLAAVKAATYIIAFGIYRIKLKAWLIFTYE